MQSDEWRDLIEAATAGREVPVRAETYAGKFDPDSDSRPRMVVADDKRTYLLKAKQPDPAKPHLPRAMTNDRIVGLLGKVIGAPVGEVTLVDLPADLTQGEPALSHMEPGITHGSAIIPDCSNRESIKYTDVPENRARFALLAILYGWAGASDHQVIYENQPPNLVHSVDHGHFFPGGPQWTEQTLSTAARARPDDTIKQGAGLSDAELHEAARRLQDVADATIAGVVAGIPDEWGLSADERVALAEYLVRRRDELLADWSPES